MKKILIIIAASAATALVGCKKYLDVNHNDNLPSDVSENLLLSPLEAVLSNNIASGSSSIMVNEWMQNITLNQPAPNFCTYQCTTSSFDGAWYDTYVSALENMYLLNTEAKANGNLLYAGIAKIMMAYTLGNTTDLWGSIPYSQALTGTDNSTPTYDTQESVYTAMQGLLDSAIANIATGSGTAPGSDDYIFSGDMTKWTKMAYTLKARYYMHLTKAPGYTAATQADLALTALESGMQSNADDCKFTYTGTATTESPWYQNLYSTTTVILASTLVDSLKSHADPRLPYLVDTAIQTGLYTGKVIGSDVGQLETYSRIGSFYGQIGSDNYIMNYSEALFLKAEATYRISGYAAASPIYRQAVASHFIKLGLDTSSTAVQAYLAKRGTLTAANALQLIMEEKSVANYLEMENYVDYRRTGYPALTRVNNALSSVAIVPRRFLYPLNEVTSNPRSEQSAQITDKVWWDN